MPLGLTLTVTLSLTPTLTLALALALSLSLSLSLSLTRQRWLAVAMLTAGVVLVTMRPDAPGKHTGFHSAHRIPLVGVCALVGASSCSALASVWFERIVKTKSSPTLWVITSHLPAMPLACLERDRQQD